MLTVCATKSPRRRLWARSPYACCGYGRRGLRGHNFPARVVPDLAVRLSQGAGASGTSHWLRASALRRSIERESHSSALFPTLPFPWLRKPRLNGALVEPTLNLSHLLEQRSYRPFSRHRRSLRPSAVGQSHPETAGVETRQWSESRHLSSRSRYESNRFV